MIYPDCGHQFPGNDPRKMPKRCPSCFPARGKSLFKKARPDLEGMISSRLKDLGIIGWEPQFHFRRSDRKQRNPYRFDLAFPECKLAIEIHGGTFIPRKLRGKQEAGAHSRGAHQHKDFMKWSQAAILGWMILHFDTKHVSNGEALKVIIQALGVLCPDRVSHLD